jgi:hypothetical protein
VTVLILYELVNLQSHSCYERRWCVILAWRENSVLKHVNTSRDARDQSACLFCTCIVLLAGDPLCETSNAFVMKMIASRTASLFVVMGGYFPPKDTLVCVQNTVIMSHIFQQMYSIQVRLISLDSVWLMVRSRWFLAKVVRLLRCTFAMPHVCLDGRMSDDQQVHVVDACYHSS